MQYYAVVSHCLEAHTAGWMDLKTIVPNKTSEVE